MRFAVVIEQAGKNYSGYVPDLPGCVATGDTVQETEQLLQEAIEIHVAGLREDGLQIPEPTSTVRYLEVVA
jgi:predicted RNase H-like HicB family nuclease